MLVDLEGHGREELFADVDLSRTVGWFTSLFPVRLDLGAIDLDGGAGGRSGARAGAEAVKEQLRALPDHGLGYGLLRYLNAETAPQLARFAIAADRLQLSGPADVARDCGLGLGGRRRAAGRAGTRRMPLAHVVEVNALTLEERDGPRLSADWSWAPRC